MIVLLVKVIFNDMLTIYGKKEMFCEWFMEIMLEFCFEICLVLFLIGKFS